MGVVKRFGFKGQSASHGTRKTHRSLGSIGASTSPGRVWKRKKMPGRHGYKNIVIRNMEIY